MTVEGAQKVTSKVEGKCSLRRVKRAVGDEDVDQSGSCDRRPKNYEPRYADLLIG